MATDGRPMVAQIILRKVYGFWIGCWPKSVVSEAAQKYRYMFECRLRCVEYSSNVSRRAAANRKGKET
jgi:hypothetical protein